MSDTIKNLTEADLRRIIREECAYVDWRSTSKIKNIKSRCLAIWKEYDDFCAQNHPHNGMCFERDGLEEQHKGLLLLAEGRCKAAFGYVIHHGDLSPEKLREMAAWETLEEARKGE